MPRPIINLDAATNFLGGLGIKGKTAFPKPAHSINFITIMHA